MLFDDSYLTLSGKGLSDIRIKSSRFMGFAAPIFSETEAKLLLNNLKKEHPQANHHCYAYRLTSDQTVYRCSDDREPSGSAGKPILGALNSNGITYAMVVVVRYFGGIQLGIPGLIQAYRESAMQAIAAAGTKEEFIRDRFRIEFPYDQLNEIFRVLRSAGAKITNQQPGEPSLIEVEIRRSFAQQLLNTIQTHPTLGHQCRIETPSHGTA